MARCYFSPVAVVLGIAVTCCPAFAADADLASSFRKSAFPVLNKFCTGCHNAELKKGGIDFDLEDPAPLFKDKEVWLKTLKMLQADMMPPKGKRRPSAEQLAELEKWIKYAEFGIDPRDPDPGRVTIRRLNRAEYRTTIRDLLGVDFNVTAEFPADDTGHGFDNISEVLTISPLLLEKYIAAAKSIVGQVVPLQPLVPVERRITGKGFGAAAGKGKNPQDVLLLSYYKAATAKHEWQVDKAGRYQLVLDLTANETFVDNQFDYNKCRFTFKAGDKVLLTQDFTRQNGKAFKFEFEVDLPAGKQELSVAVEPLTPKEKQVRLLTLRVLGVTVRGPMAKEDWVRPANHEKFFPGGIPTDPQERAVYVGKLLNAFVTKAFRRPVDAATVARLVHFAEDTAAKPGKTFEEGLAQAMIVTLASPRFLFREEWAVPHSTDKYPLLDEYALASRLSYFLWSSMPDEELLKLAGETKLRDNLTAQVARMLADKRSGEFMRNYAGQWLQARGIDSSNVNAAAVLAKETPLDPAFEAKRARFRELRVKEMLTDAEKKELEDARGAFFFKGVKRFTQYELTGDLRKAMRQETEMAFEHVVRADRSLLELIDADYTFLNEKLAKFYGIDGVTGDQMRQVKLPANSHRGGILTQACFLIITSNPDRTSPVKRGLFILDNILGVPPPPPPPDIPPLEEAAAALKGKTPPTLKETLKLHRAAALCNSCHNRMDPLGLAFENFNGIGLWRDKELNQPIEPAGELLTGEGFKDVQELKKVLTNERRLDFYRCATEKMLIYALGRGLEPTDTHTVDDIVSKLDAAKGQATVLISNIIKAPAFQRRRPAAEPVAATAELKTQPKNN